MWPSFNSCSLIKPSLHIHKKDFAILNLFSHGLCDNDTLKRKTSALNSSLFISTLTSYTRYML